MLARRWLPELVLGAGLIAGVAWNPLPTSVAAAGLFAIALALYLRKTLSRHYLGLLGLGLIGYLFMGRGFAYLGLPPLFVGEGLLVLGLLTVAVTGALPTALRSHLSWLVLAFMLLGAVRTAPFLGSYGVDALRDAVMWGYAAFALIVASLLLFANRVNAALQSYRRLLPWVMTLLPATLILFQFAGASIPVVPGTDVQLIFLKSGDVAVHLAGAMAFVLLGLSQPLGRTRRLGEWLWWPAWLVGIAVAASANRGGLLAIALVMLVVLMAKPFTSRWPKLAFIGFTLLVTVYALDLRIETSRRDISVQQIVANLQSVVVAPDESRDGTSQWRVVWWQDIVDYTLYGEFFWTGKGYGINLASADGYIVDSEETVRNPHNSLFTILARGGVPSAALWLLLQAAFALSLLRGYARARRTGHQRWASVTLWVFCYWLAFIVNSSFDIFLEGPQGGIWFWSLFGFGIAVLEIQRRQSREPPPRLGTADGTIT